MTRKEKLKKVLDSKSIRGKNKKILDDYFGEENLKRLPFKKVYFKANDNPYDDVRYDCNLLTGKFECVALCYKEEEILTEYFLKRIEEIILKKIEKL